MLLFLGRRSELELGLVTNQVQREDMLPRDSIPIRSPPSCLLGIVRLVLPDFLGESCFPLFLCPKTLSQHLGSQHRKHDFSYECWVKSVVSRQWYRPRSSSDFPFGCGPNVKHFKPKKMQAIINFLIQMEKGCSERNYAQEGTREGSRGRGPYQGEEG